jgi:hypothetical protein
MRGEVSEGVAGLVEREVPARPLPLPVSSGTGAERARGFLGASLIKPPLLPLVLIRASVAATEGRRHCAAEAGASASFWPVSAVGGQK